jgi:hypothetical protein
VNVYIENPVPEAECIEQVGEASWKEKYPGSHPASIRIRYSNRAGGFYQRSPEMSTDRLAGAALLVLQTYQALESAGGALEAWERTLADNIESSWEHWKTVRDVISELDR